MSGAKLQLNVMLDYDSLPDVKKTIEKTTKIPVALQHLMLAGVIQDDADWLSLEERGIQEGDTLHLVVSSAEVVSPLTAQRAACAAIACRISCILEMRRRQEEITHVQGSILFDARCVRSSCTSLRKTVFLTKS